MRSAFTSLLLTATIGLLTGAGSAVAAVTTTGSLTTARTQAAGVAVPSGATTASVVVTGGRDSTGTPLNTIERYAPAPGTWAAGAPMSAPRAGHTAFFVPPTGALTTARIVVVGGTTLVRATETPATSPDRYDPATDTWVLGAGGPARQNRVYAQAAIRGNPQILAIGGQTGTPVTVPDVDAYDIVNDTWTAVAAMTTERRGHAAVTLPDGRVLVAGGYNANNALLTSTEIYDPATNVWTTGPPMASPRARFTLSVVDGRHVLAIGGVADAANTPLTTTESFDPVTNAWSSAGALAVGRYDQQATVVRSGWVAVTGGRGSGGSALDSAESWTPQNGWAGPTALSGTQTLGGARVDHVAAAIPQTDRVLVAGGGVPSALAASTVTATSALWTPDAPPVVPTTPPATTPAPTTPEQTTPPPTPVQGRTFVAGRASGNVFIRIGTTDEYRELTDDEGVPFGTVIDATDGHVRVTAIVGGVLQTAEFWGGTFIVNQAKDGWIEIRLYGTLKCKNGKPVRSKKAERLVKRKSKPKAWGDGKGRFRTRGKHSSAAVTGTRWLVEERCTGTFTRVARGTVRVRDFPKHKNVTVKAGKTYLARPARK